MKMPWKKPKQFDFPVVELPASEDLPPLYEPQIPVLRGAPTVGHFAEPGEEPPKEPAVEDKTYEAVLLLGESLSKVAEAMTKSVTEMSDAIRMLAEKEAPAPVINVQPAENPAPVVNVAPAEVNVEQPQIVVEPADTKVEVNVPEQPSPVVNVQPRLTLERPSQKVEVKDANGEVLRTYESEGQGQ